MKINYIEIYNLVNEINSRLELIGDTERLKVKDIYNTVEIAKMNILTNTQEVIFGNIARDNGYYWLLGINMGLRNH